MGAARELDSGGDGVSLHELRPLVGAEVAAVTAGGAIEGTLLSCTAQSAWIVVGDVDHLVALPHLHAIRRCEHDLVIERGARGLRIGVPDDHV